MGITVSMKEKLIEILSAGRLPRLMTTEYLASEMKISKPTVARYMREIAASGYRIQTVQIDGQRGRPTMAYGISLGKR